MKRKNSVLALAFLLALCNLMMVSCGKSDRYGLKRLEGRWQANVQGTTWIESWFPGSANDVLLTGSGKELHYGGEKPVEEMTIALKNDVLVYSVKASGQNDEKPVDFTLTKDTPESLRFENAQHDFPQYILYEFVDENHIIARIGKIGDEQTDREFVFDFQRLKENP